MTTAGGECGRLFPSRAEAECVALADRLAAILATAAASWEKGSLAQPSCDAVAKTLLDELVAAEFVVVHFG